MTDYPNAVEVLATSQYLIWRVGRPNKALWEQMTVDIRQEYKDEAQVVLQALFSSVQADPKKDRIAVWREECEKATCENGRIQVAVGDGGPPDVVDCWVCNGEGGAYRVGRLQESEPAIRLTKARRLATVATYELVPPPSEPEPRET